MEFSLLNTMTMITSKRKSGKSQLTRWLIMKERHKFSKIFLISPTETMNHHYEKIISKKNMYKTFSETWLKKLMDKMSKINDRKTNEDANHVLIILDDCALSIEKADKTMELLYSIGRHYFISVILISQYLYQFSRTMRQNSDWVICGQGNAKTLQNLNEEFLFGNITKDEFNDMYKDATSNHGFLLINTCSVKDNNDLNSIYGILRTPEKYLKI